MKRVMIVGQPGSGKSTLARRIGEKTGLPVIHMDAAVHWKPGWVERPRSEKIMRALEIEQRETWVFEGNMSSTYDHRLSRADTLIVLDLPLRLRVWRVFKRTILSYGSSRQDLPENCPEHLTFEFYKWIWDTRHVQREKQRSLIDQAGAHVTTHLLESRREVDYFLKNLSQT